MILAPPGSAYGTGPARTYATLDPANKGANITLSASNTVGTIGAPGIEMVQSTIGKSSKKYYWEMKITAVALGLWAVGITKTAAVSIRSLGDIANDWGYQPITGQIRNNGAAYATWSTAALNDVLGFALDMDNSTLAVYKNNTLLGTVTGIAAGTWYPAASTGGSNGDSITANFGATRTLVYSQPAGFNSGLFT